mgnify:CR=1 FL=1
MRLDLLMERELFDDVFIVTLSKYLKAHYRWNGTIKWNKFNLFHSTKFNLHKCVYMCEGKKD